MRPWKQQTRTFGEIANGQLAPRIQRQVLERNVLLALAHHQVHDNQALEDDGPCCVPETALEGPKNLRNPSFARVRRDKDMFDVFRFGRGKLGAVSRAERTMQRRATLILVAPLTDFSQPEAIWTGLGLAMNKACNSN
jgi:hypothetical protein